MTLFVSRIWANSGNVPVHRQRQTDETDRHIRQRKTEGRMDRQTEIETHQTDRETNRDTDGHRPRKAQTDKHALPCVCHFRATVLVSDKARRLYSDGASVDGSQGLRHFRVKRNQTWIHVRVISQRNEGAIACLCHRLCHFPSRFSFPTPPFPINLLPAM